MVQACIKSSVTSKNETKRKEKNSSSVVDFTSFDKARLAVESAIGKKGYDIVLLDMQEVSTICDWFVLISANSARRVSTILKAIQDKLSESNIKPLNKEGRDKPYWSLLDYGDFVVHIFQDHVRQFYGLERLWSDAPKITVDEKWLQKTSPRS